MTVIELINKMYYAQKLRIFDLDKYDKLKKRLIYEGDNQGLRSCQYRPLFAREVIGFGVGHLTNVIDINVE